MQIIRGGGVKEDPFFFFTANLKQITAATFSSKKKPAVKPASSLQRVSFLKNTCKTRIIQISASRTHITLPYKAPAVYRQGVSIRFEALNIKGFAKYASNL